MSFPGLGSNLQYLKQPTRQARRQVLVQGEQVGSHSLGASPDVPFASATMTLTVRDTFTESQVVESLEVLEGSETSTEKEFEPAVENKTPEVAVVQESPAAMSMESLESAPVENKASAAPPAPSSHPMFEAYWM